MVKYIYRCHQNQLLRNFCNQGPAQFSSPVTQLNKYHKYGERSPPQIQILNAFTKT